MFCLSWVRVCVCDLEKWTSGYVGDHGSEMSPVRVSIMGDRYRNRIREFVDCKYQFPSLFVKSLLPPPVLEADGPGSCGPSRGGRVLIDIFYFR